MSAMLFLVVGAALILLGVGSLVVAGLPSADCNDTGAGAKCQAPVALRIGETWGAPVAAVGILVLAAGGVAWRRGRRQTGSP